MYLTQSLQSRSKLSPVKRTWVLPNRLRAGSMLLGLLVAAMTMTWALCFRPSIRVSS